MEVRNLLIPDFLLRKKQKLPAIAESFYGSGRRIRTLTYGVRVRCATFTQSRYVPKNKNYYTGFGRFVNSFFLRDRVLFLRALCSLGGAQIGSGEVLLQGLIQHGEDHQAQHHVDGHIAAVVGGGVQIGV